jgi:hypothetical protein
MPAAAVARSKPLNAFAVFIYVLQFKWLIVRVIVGGWPTMHRLDSISCCGLTRKSQFHHITAWWPQQKGSVIFR